MRVVINTCYGGFSLSDKAEQEYQNRTGHEDSYLVDREDPVLINIIEEMGTEAAGTFAKLKILEIPDVEYSIHEYDGLESIKFHPEKTLVEQMLLVDSSLPSEEYKAAVLMILERYNSDCRKVDTYYGRARRKN